MSLALLFCDFAVAATAASNKQLTHGILSHPGFMILCKLVAVWFGRNFGVGCEKSGYYYWYFILNFVRNHFYDFTVSQFREFVCY